MLFENLTMGYQRQLESGIAALHELLGAMERTVIEQSTRLEQALKLTHQASRAKSEFLSTISHEIRTPMNVVLGMADMLKETELAPEQRHYLDVMVSNGNSLMDLINSVLDLARIESGRLELEQQQFELTELIDRTTATFAVQAHSKGLELVARIAPGTPEYLIGDPMRLRQIIVNLVANAIKFTESGGVVIEVESRLNSPALVELRFNVADSGIGIAKENLKKIFQNFTQVDSSVSRKYGGSGLGLAIAKRLTDLMHGKISVASEVGVGTKFAVTVEFPLAAEGGAVTPAAPDLRKHRVLIVDDHRINRQMLRETLTECHAEVSEAASADEALWSIRYAVAMNKPYQIVLLCMRMAEGGHKLLRRIGREQLPIAPAVPMLYSDDIRHQVARLKEYGLEIYLVKPIARRELFRTIGRMLAAADGVSPQVHIEQMPESPLPLSLNGRPLRILIAEDSTDNRFVIESYLRKEPCSVTFVKDGQQAVSNFIANDFDLVFMDVQMPKVDGLSATRSIRKWESEHGRQPVPIIALTASALEEDIARSLLAGCDAHISKPVKKRVIMEAIRKAAHHQPSRPAIVH